MGIIQQAADDCTQLIGHFDEPLFWIFTALIAILFFELGRAQGISVTADKLSQLFNVFR